MEHSRTSHKLTKTIKQAEKVSEIFLAKIVIALYIVEPQNVKFLLAKLTKPSDALKLMQVLIMSIFGILSILNCNLKRQNLQLELIY